jgi:hypothetical protein
MRGAEGTGRARRRDAERTRLDALETEGFVPYLPWRDVTERIRAMEHGVRVRAAAGMPIATITRRSTPKWAR